MKNKTKRKIISFVENVLGYEYPMQIPYKTEEKKIIKVESNLLLYEYDIKHDVDFFVTNGIAKELVKQKLIEVLISKNIKQHIHEQDTWTVLAKLNVIK